MEHRQGDAIFAALCLPGQIYPLRLVSSPLLPRFCIARLSDSEVRAWCITVRHHVCKTSLVIVKIGHSLIAISSVSKVVQSSLSESSLLFSPKYSIRYIMSTHKTLTLETQLKILDILFMQLQLSMLFPLTNFVISMLFNKTKKKKIIKIKIKETKT